MYKRQEIEFSSAEAPDVAEFFKDSEVLAAFAMEDCALAVSEEKVRRISVSYTHLDVYKRQDV